MQQLESPNQGSRCFSQHIIAMLYLRYLCLHQVLCTILQLRLFTFNRTRKLIKVQAISVDALLVYEMYFRINKLLFVIL